MAMNDTFGGAGFGNEMRCSFCGKTRSQVSKLIAGPDAEQQCVDNVKALQEKGAEVLVCGTCLNFFGIGDDLEIAAQYPLHYFGYACLFLPLFPFTSFLHSESAGQGIYLPRLDHFVDLYQIPDTGVWEAVHIAGRVLQSVGRTIECIAPSLLVIIHTVVAKIVLKKRIDLVKSPNGHIAEVAAGSLSSSPNV